MWALDVGAEGGCADTEEHGPGHFDAIKGVARGCGGQARRWCCGRWEPSCCGAVAGRCVPYGSLSLSALPFFDRRLSVPTDDAPRRESRTCKGLLSRAAWCSRGVRFPRDLSVLRVLSCLSAVPLLSLARGHQTVGKSILFCRSFPMAAC
ncbi:hypothetical protein DFH06DRAFT_1247021 [Mycena polygramma]|nr:hypothetical protein DFH06DRAFT_1247021 [Mycena polygramma]